MKKQFLCILALTTVLQTMNAQTHLEPADGAEGVPGPVPSSFVIKWASVDSAASYEYVMSNNEQCFAACPGDTRQKSTGSDTVSIEFNLIEGILYYWITRVSYIDGSTGPWSVITSFRAITPPEVEPEELIKILQNPSSDQLNIEIDWAAKPEALQISLEILSLGGQSLGPRIIIEKNSLGRYQLFDYEISLLPQGIYLASFIVDDEHGTPIVKKLVVAR